MTNSATIKIRTIGGASVLALSAGLSTAAFAQAAPVQAPPAAPNPTAPANAEECALIVSATPPEIVCAPGTDADGFQEPFSSIVLTVEEGSQVQGEVSLLFNPDIIVNGDIVTSGAAESGVTTDVDGEVFVNGIVQTSGDDSFGVSAGARSEVSVTGTVFTSGATSSAVNLGDDATVTNEGDIVTTGDSSSGIVVLNNSTVTNTADGRIITDGNGSGGVFGGDANTVLNEGLIQTFGAGSPGIRVGDDSTVTNAAGAFIFTTGFSSRGIVAGDNTSIINEEDATIFTFGPSNFSILAGAGADFENSGIVASSGDSAPAVELGDGSTLTNNVTGDIASNGTSSNAVNITGDGTVSNAGLIQAAGAGSDGLNIAGEGVVDNTGRITSIDGIGLFVDGVATVTNGVGAQISSENSDAVQLTAAGSSVVNDGLIQSRGGAGLSAFGDDASITNNGTIQALSGGDVAVGVGDGATVVNTGTLFSADSLGIVANELLTVDNSGLILGNGGIGILAFSGDITNSGRIESDGQAINFDGSLGNNGIVTNLADGVIVGGDVGVFGSVTDSQTVRNFGVIEGGGGTAVDLGAGDDTYLAVNDGTTIGTVVGGAGTDLFAFIVTDETDRTFDLGSVDATFEDIRIGSQTFDFATNMAGMTPATGVVTITGASTQEITIVNTAIFAGTTNSTVNYVIGFEDGIALGVTNTGTIDTIAGAAAGVGFDGSVDGAIFNNEGLVETSGSNTAAVLFGDNGTLNNTGAILSQGLSGVAVAADDNAVINNAAGGTITTTGDNGFGIVIQGDGTVDNDGIISTSGPTAQAITIGGAATILNDGVIAAAGGRAIDVAFESTIVNGADGTIGSAGGDAIRFNGNGSSLDNAGTVGTTGDGFVAVLGLADTTVTNSGEITTDGNDTAAIFLTTGATIDNSGSILSTGTNGVAIAIESGDITNAAGATITTDGDNGFGIVITGDGSVTNDGIIATNGPTAQAITIGGMADVTNSGVIGAEGGRAVDIAMGTVTNTETGVIGSSGGSAVRLASAGASLVNAGTVGTDAAFAAVEGVAQTSVTNSGTITTSTDGTASVVLEGNSVLDNSGTIEATGDGSVAATLGAGGTITNTGAGSITTSGDGSFTVVLADGGTITNEASISATGMDSQAITSGADLTLTNSGSITADAGRAVDVAGVATIDNLAGGTIMSTGIEAIRLISASTVTNSGSISGTTAILGSTGGDTVVNFGSLTGDTDAVSLGAGADEFQQWSGATVTGNVDLGGDDDTFILEGASSSVSGTIDGGAGTDIAILAGVFDSDNFANFESFQLGSTLGGTLNDLTIIGDRVLDVPVVHTGIVNIGLGTATLTTSETITLESTGVLNIETPLDGNLIGQNVLVFQADGGITNDGATVNILDDDLLVDYALLVSATDITVDVTGVNPLVNNSDPNLAVFGAAVADAVNNGTISQANFDVLNDLATEADFAAAGRDALPSLSDGVGREIFESGSVASQALERHIATEGTGLWGQFVVRGAEQDALSQTADGYESDQLIFTVGGDVALGDNIRIGLLASYADIEVEDENATGVPGSLSEVDSIRLGAYLAVNFLERGFINTEISYLTGDVDASRTGVFGPITSNYDFDGVAVRSTIGYDLLPDENITLAPSIGINAAEISFDDTVETGGFNFNVERGDAEYVEGRLGLLFGAQFSEGVDGFIQGTVVHDFTDTTRSFRLSGAELPTFTAVLPLRETDRFELNAGLSVEVSEQLDVQVGYLGDFNSGYDAHSARASVVIAF